MNPTEMSAARLVAAYAAGELSPVEATTAVLDRIEEADGELGAFCLVDREGALAQARRSEERWVAGHASGLLDGVPVSIKDIFLTKGWPTLRGSRAVDPDQPWEVDAPVSARLRADGMVFVGKTTTPELAWKAVTDSPLTGVTRNPVDPALTPGGSSGGASAAVAAGMGPCAVGTDGGGSIRIPAAFTGTVGVKPTYGSISRFGI
ncbi:MAG: amidase family protein, partial [Actinomycetaceae bacterium]